MSYILDALKKADSERQHGKVPNIHAQQLTHRALDDEDSALKNPMMWVFLTVLTLMLGAFLLFYNWTSTPQPAAIAPPEMAVAPPVIAAAPSAPTAANGMVAQETTPALPISAVGAVVNPAPVTPMRSEPAKLKPVPKLLTQTKKEKRSTPPATPESSAKKSVLKQVAEPTTETVEMTLRDLPQTIQNEIPTVTVGGYIYSDNRADSQLLINKLLLHEGEQVAPGLILEKMMPHSAILSYRGYRYRISY